ncbi:TIR domain-containing protein [Spongiibacter sp. UBA1325]|uniref:TIR domain-containing protein n=1 Tax=Spongiibacter sp. UBA1325 TaxID=1947543 RepID=UPI00257CAC82|nr:TIR domain-containing protein [Spongiibacter sp. UBA1325]|tara:strand:+ start:2068 stop:4923 length:2856 start_codon:yes stop_codon:yes gene_type:complete
MEIKKIFISYSWDSESHKEWVLKLANELEEYFELHITLDQYDLDSFEDKNHFMEKGVFDNDIIIMLVTPQYVKKANERLGGVGIETKMSSARHWEESLSQGKSNIIPVLRKGSELPNYLKEKFHIDFRNESNYEASFMDLINHISGNSKAARPTKKRSITQKPIHKDLTKIDDFLKINHKKRSLVFDRNETTDFSAGNRIKFELWETKSPAVNHYLFLFDNIVLKPTIERLCNLIKDKKIYISRLTILRSKKGDKGYIGKLLAENDCRFAIDEITFSDYIWDYCIEDDAKVPSRIYKQKFFIDQPLLTLDEESISKGPAFDFLKEELNKDIQTSAKVIIAPGGTGKTTLCQYIASEYQNPENAISVFIQSEELRESSQVDGVDKSKIESVYDLYELYSQVISAQGSAQLIYDKATFEVALITGRLVLVIDGMDEIISLFPETLDLDAFLKSIEDLNRQLASCKIVITSRNDVFDFELMEKYEHLDKYQLLGFDESACESYLARRFRNLPQPEALKQKVLSNIKPLLKSDEKQRILPFVVDLLSSLAEDSSDDEVNIELSFDGKNYESNEDITDYLVYSVLRREWQRQKIEIPVEDVLEIFLEISSTHKDHFLKSDFEDIVSIFGGDNNDELFTKMLRNPLLAIDGDLCRFKYDFIADYFKSLYIINSINAKSSNDDFIKLIAKNAYGENEVMSSTAQYYSERQESLLEGARCIISDLKSEISASDVMSNNDSKYRAIAFLVKLCSISSKCNNSKEQFTSLLTHIFESSSVFKNLAIYGDSTPLDLVGINIVDSRFVGYKSFSKSKFESTKISNCFFESCYNENPSKSFTNGEFNSCRLGDLELVIAGAEERSEKDRALIENELRNFLNSFFHRGAFTDKKLDYIKMSTRIKSINRAFFQRLVKEDIIQVKVEKSSETYYVIAPHYEDSVYGFLSNNKIDRRIEKVIEFIEQ